MDPTQPLTEQALTQVFESAEKPVEKWRIGLEAEKFGFDAQNRPLKYEGERGVQGLLSWLTEHRGWKPYRETPDGPVVALQRGDASVTLEPGGQVELSGAPHATLHEVAREYDAHLAELRDAEQDLDVWFAHVGFHPVAVLDELPWVPKRRYPIMRQYLPTRGARGLDMMLRTATVQVNLDYSSEEDALHKLVTLLRLTPLVQAMTLNSPFVAGGRGERKSERLDVWLNMDPQRSGLIHSLWNKARLTYDDYVQWALDAGMFLFVRDGQVIANTGQTFRDFMLHGYQGQQANAEDWRLHLGTLFPEVRLKSTLEVRCCDSAAPPFTYVMPALLTGLCYDAQSLDRAREIAERVRLEDAVALQRAVAVNGLQATLGGEPILPLCLRLLELAQAGLQRRAQNDMGSGEDESKFLLPLQRSVEQGLTPADLLLNQYRAADGNPLLLLRRLWHECR